MLRKKHVFGRNVKENEDYCSRGDQVLPNHFLVFMGRDRKSYSYNMYHFSNFCWVIPKHITIKCVTVDYGMLHLILHEIVLNLCKDLKMNFVFFFLSCSATCIVDFFCMSGVSYWISIRCLLSIFVFIQNKDVRDDHNRTSVT